MAPRESNELPVALRGGKVLSAVYRVGAYRGVRPVRRTATRCACSRADPSGIAVDRGDELD